MATAVSVAIAPTVSMAVAVGGSFAITIGAAVAMPFTGSISVTVSVVIPLNLVAPSDIYSCGSGPAERITRTISAGVTARVVSTLVRVRGRIGLPDGTLAC